MPKNLLLEAGFLCLPETLFAPGLPDFREILGDVLRHEKFEFARLRCWISQHRIGILIEGIADSQSGTIKEVRGPKASGAYDFNNQPSPAANGFAAAQGLEFKDLVTREIDGEKFLFAVKSTAGQSLERCLPALKDKLFAALPFMIKPWREKSRFPQPPLYFTAMLNSTVPNLELEGIKATDQSGYKEGLELKFYPLSHAGDYPQLMNKIGLINEISERRKTFEARIRSILPEGYLPRADQNRSCKICFFSEGMQPMLLKFDSRFLEIPEAALHRYLLINNGYLACEDARGKILPAAIAVTEHVKPTTNEVALRNSALEAQLKKLLAKWHRDKARLPDTIAAIGQKIAAGDNSAFDCENSLARSAQWLGNKLLGDKDLQVVATIIALITEGEKTELASLIPGTGFAVVVNCLGDDANLKPLHKYFDEICNYFANRLPAPVNLVAQVVCLAILLRSHAEPYSGVQASIGRIVTFLRATANRLDIFHFFKDVFPEFALDQRQWLMDCASDALSEQQFTLVSDSFWFAEEFDPVSLYESARDWKDFGNKEIEVFTSLFMRIKAKIENIAPIFDKNEACSISAEIDQLLTQVEVAPGVNYGQILNFLHQQKVNIEACLINLPSVLDDNHPEQKPKIALLQRIVSQVSRLPFITKDKNPAKK